LLVQFANDYEVRPEDGTTGWTTLSTTLSVTCVDGSVSPMSPRLTRLPSRQN